ncbi:MAG: CaiB/BaiF CoA-transferase family protein, partial [Rubrivivax sp.]
MSKAKVLAGVRVLEHGTFITGPAASMLLADLGADVVKVEQPEGDPFRAFRGGSYSPHYQTYNRNKKSVRLDTRKPEDLKLFDTLVGEADVYIQNFRPGVAAKIGAGEARLRELNPGLVYCAISGFGPDGPSAARPSYDTVAQAASGFLKLLVNPANPRVVGPAIADALTGFYAALGILGALVERERKAGGGGQGRPDTDGGAALGRPNIESGALGRPNIESGALGRPNIQSGALGRRVEVSMFEAMTHFNLDAFTHLFSEGEVMGPYSRPSVSQSYVMKCSDGKWIALHMSSPPKFWEGLAKAIGQPDLFDDARFATREARIDNQETLIGVLGAHFAREPRSEWCRRLEALDVPHAPMYETNEVPEDAQAKHLQLFVDAPHPGKPGTRWTTVRSPLSFDGER